jgi:hypothetical protein
MQIAKEAVEKRISSMVNESAERQKRFDKSLVDYQKEKETLIETCLLENKATSTLILNQLRLGLESVEKTSMAKIRRRASGYLEDCKSPLYRAKLAPPH